MAAELKPCPFCGSKNAAPYSVKSCHSVLCVACGGEGPEADSEEGAIAAWNLRTPGVMACDTVELTRLADAFERSADWLDKGVLTGSRRTHPLVGTADYLKAAEALRAAAGVKASETPADCGKCIDPTGCADGVCYRAWCAADERRSLDSPALPGDAELLATSGVDVPPGAQR